jgi:hypothetical protein
VIELQQQLGRRMRLHSCCFSCGFAAGDTRLTEKNSLFDEEPEEQ